MEEMMSLQQSWLMSRQRSKRTNPWFARKESERTCRTISFFRKHDSSSSLRRVLEPNAWKNSTALSLVPKFYPRTSSSWLYSGMFPCSKTLSLSLVSPLLAKSASAKRNEASQLKRLPPMSNDQRLAQKRFASFQGRICAKTTLNYLEVPLGRRWNFFHRKATSLLWWLPKQRQNVWEALHEVRNATHCKSGSIVREATALEIPFVLHVAKILLCLGETAKLSSSMWRAAFVKAAKILKLSSANGQLGTENLMLCNKETLSK